jgi:hypothetical protein
MAAIQLVDSGNDTVPGLALSCLFTAGTQFAFQTFTTKTTSSINRLNDTFTGTNANTRLVWTAVPVAYGFTHLVSISNLSTTLDILDWNLRLYLHVFAGAKPRYYADGTGLWETGSPPAASDQGFDTQGKEVGWGAGGPQITFLDPNPTGGTGTGWQIWYTDDPTNPIGLHFGGRFGNTGNHWGVYLDPTNNSSGGSSAYCDYFIPKGTTFKTSVKARFVPGSARPDASVVVPEAYASIAKRWPLLVSQTSFSGRMRLGAAFVAPSTPSFPNNTGTNVPLAVVDTAVTLPSAGSTFTVTATVKTYASGQGNPMGTTAQLVKAGARVGFSTSMTGGVYAANAVTCAVVSASFSGTTVSMSLRNDDGGNPAGASLAVGLNVYQDWTYNPRRWNSDPLLQLVNPATGNLFASEGVYAGLDALRVRIVSTFHFCTDILMGKVPDKPAGGTLNMTDANSGCTPGSAFSAAAIVPWDLFSGSMYSQADPSYLGDPASALFPTLLPQVYVPELTYTDGKRPKPVVEDACNAMGVGSNGTVYPKCYAGATFRANWLKASTNFFYGVHQDFYQSLGDTTLGSDLSKVLYPSSGAMGDGSAFSTAGYPAPTLPSNQP